jgi:hypothetical protein
MHRGYIRLWRCIKENLFWQDTPFDRGRAWIDLIMLANHKDSVLFKRGIKIEVLRGQVGWSERQLADRWGWSRGKVRRFLDDLKEEKQIEPHNGPQNGPQNLNVTSLITIINYDKYQADEPQNERKTGHKRTTNSTIENELKNEKNKAIEFFDGNLEIFEKCWSEYPRREGKKEAIRHYKASVKSIDDARKLFVAIQHYKDRTEGQEMKFIKQGSSFFNNWSDYVE